MAINQMTGNQSQGIETSTESSTNPPTASHHQSAGEILSSMVAYNEMADVPVQYVDPVAEVQKNLAHLEELQVRLKFMMREIRYLMKV